MNLQTINTPEKLHQAIGTFLQSDYSHEDLIKMYDDTRKCAASFRGIYSDLSTLPVPKGDPLDDLQGIMDWSKEASEAVDAIVSNLEQQTINEAISLLKKLRGFADCVISLVDSSLKEQAQKEARAKVEKEYKNLNEKAEKASAEAAKIDTSKMPLIPLADYYVEQTKIRGELQQEEQKIKKQETEDIVQIYLSKDPTLKDKLFQLHNEEVNKAIEALKKLVGSDTSTGKQLDIYCKLKDIPLQLQFDDVGYAYCLNDYTDMICGGCNRLYTSIDTFIKTFEGIRKRLGTGEEKRITHIPPKFTDKNGKVFEGEEAWRKMWEKFLEYGRYTIPEKPFADKPIKITDNNYGPGEGYRELLTEEERKVLMKAVPELSDAGLEAVLRRVYNMGDEYIKNLTWKQIFAFCKDYIDSQMPENTGFNRKKTKNSGDTYKIIAKHVSLGDQAQHADRDINKNTSKPKKKWEKWVMILATIATILTFLFGDDIWSRLKPSIQQIRTPKTENKTTMEAKTDITPPPHKIVQQTMSDSPGGTQVAGDLYINETENTLDKPIVVASATVEVKITSDWDFNGRVANTKAYLAFVKGDKPLLITSSIGYTASQTGNNEVVYKAKLDMDAKDSAVGNPASFLRDAEYIQIEFGRMPSDSHVLEGDAICIINNSVRLKFSIPPQNLVNNRIFIRSLSESLQVLNESKK